MNTTSSSKVIVPGGYDLFVPGLAMNYAQRPGFEKVNLRELGILPGMVGGAPVHGIQQQGDVLTQLADGTPLTGIWDDFMQLLNAANASRQAIINFLTFSVTNPTETVTQPGDGVDFEESTELGVPVRSRVQPNYFQLGYTFKWYDLSSQYSWMYLAEATRQQVDSVANAAVEAYYPQLMVEMLEAFYSNTNITATIRNNTYNVYRFYNADGTVPPVYKTNSFSGSHTHYVQSGAA